MTRQYMSVETGRPCRVLSGQRLWASSTRMTAHSYLLTIPIGSPGGRYFHLKLYRSLFGTQVIDYEGMPRLYLVKHNAFNKQDVISDSELYYVSHLQRGYLESSELELH